MFLLIANNTGTIANNVYIIYSAHIVVHRTFIFFMKYCKFKTYLFHLSQFNTGPQFGIDMSVLIEIWYNTANGKNGHMTLTLFADRRFE